jgi:hypothetical protein
MMIQMNVPKYLWSEAVMTVVYLINRMPSRILGMKSPAELLLGQREFKLPLRVFGCVCFVKDHRPSVGKLDPHAVKCIFVGYSSTQKGYKCWDPVGRKLFVSMDVTLREFEPYYTKKGDLEQFLEEFSSVNESDSRGGRMIVSIIVGITILRARLLEQFYHSILMMQVGQWLLLMRMKGMMLMTVKWWLLGQSHVPQIQVVRPMIRKKRPVTSNLLYIREGGLRIRGKKLSYHNHNTLGRKLSYHNHNMLTLQSQSSPQIPIHQTHRSQQK